MVTIVVPRIRDYFVGFKGFKPNVLKTFRFISNLHFLVLVLTFLKGGKDNIMIKVISREVSVLVMRESIHSSRISQEFIQYGFNAFIPLLIVTPSIHLSFKT